MEFVWERQDKMDCGARLDVSTRGLNTSLPSCEHPGPIKPVLYWSPVTESRFRLGFKLRCFQLLSLVA